MADTPPPTAAVDAGGGHGAIEIETELTRDMGLTTALSIGVGTMIAAGIFTLSGLAVKQVGSAAILAFLLAALVATFTALTYCEFASIYPESGEGYLYARKTYPAPLAYIVGWCLLLGYTSSCGFYIASFSTYFNEFVWAPPGVVVHHEKPAEKKTTDKGQPEIKQAAEGHSTPKRQPLAMISGLVALAALTLLNIKGTKESGTFQIIVTAGKVLLLCWFVAGGISSVNAEVLQEKFTTDLLKIGGTAAMVFITFFGFSAIAASAGEVTNPTKTIPRAIFISMGVVTVLYTLVVLVVLGAGLTEYSETAMGAAAKRFLGPIGMKVIVAGALFSMISASNASILAGSRVALSMAQLGHLPKEIGTINQQTRTPVIALLLVGGAIGFFAYILPLKDLAHFADCVLLSVLILVNVALIAHRKMFPDLKRPFRVPLVPFLPLMGVAANLYLVSQIIGEGWSSGHLLPVILAFFAVVTGFLAYLAWKGAQVAETALPGAASRVALERSAGAPGKFRVLVPIANPNNVNQLIDLAATIAKANDGEIVAVRVVVVPEQLPPSLEDAQVEEQSKLLELARARALEHDVPITSLIRLGHNAARAIVETVRDRSCNLVILGWKGFTSTARKILGEVTDDVVRYAPCDIMLVKMAGSTGDWKRLILPTAGGEHAKAAMKYAMHLLGDKEDASLTLLSVIRPEDPPERKASEEERLKKELEALEGPAKTESRIVTHRSVTEAIRNEGQAFDALVLGATRESYTSQILFGSVPEDIARESKKPVIVVKQYHAVKALVGRVMSE